MPGSYPGDGGSIPPPATNSRPSPFRVGLAVIVLAFLLGAACMAVALPLLVIYRNWCHELDDDDNPAATFEDAFTPKGDK